MNKHVFEVLYRQFGSPLDGLRVETAHPGYLDKNDAIISLRKDSNTVLINFNIDDLIDFFDKSSKKLKQYQMKQLLKGEHHG